jgi:hypothetical protein
MEALALLQALQAPSASGAAPQGVSMDLQALAALAALQQSDLGQGVGAGGVPPAQKSGPGPRAAAPGGGTRTRSGDSRSSSAYASRHQVRRQGVGEMRERCAGPEMP